MSLRPVSVVNPPTFVKHQRLKDSRTRTTMSIRFLKFFFTYFSKNRHPGKLHCTFVFTKKLALLYLVKEVKPFPDHNIVIILVFASILAKTYSRIISFSSRLSDIGKRQATCWRGGKKEKGTAAPAILHRKSEE